MEVIQTNGGDFAGKLVAKRQFSKDEVIASFEQTATIAHRKSFSSLQIGRDKHIELNSDLMYLNHSCDPNCFVDVARKEVRAIKTIEKGTELTFFYPSTEWEMAQPFECWCGAKNCLGVVKGAKYLNRADADRFQLNMFIIEMLQEQ